MERRIEGVTFETVRLGGPERGRGRGWKPMVIAVAWVVGLGALVANGVVNRPAPAPTTANYDTTPGPVVVATPSARANRFDPGEADLVLLRLRPAGDIVHVHGDVQQRRTIQLVVWVDGDAAATIDPPRDPLAASTAAVTVNTDHPFDVALPLPRGVPYGEIFVEANAFDVSGDLVSRTRTRLSDAAQVR